MKRGRSQSPLWTQQEVCLHPHKDCDAPVSRKPTCDLHTVGQPFPVLLWALGRLSPEGVAVCLASANELRGSEVCHFHEETFKAAVYLAMSYSLSL